MSGRLLARIAAIVVWLIAITSGASILARPEGVFALPLIVAPGYGTAGLIIALHRPTHRIGWLLLGLAALPGSLTVLGATPPLINGTALFGASLLLVLFPTGRPPAKRWLFLPALLAAAWSMPTPAIGTDEFSVPSGVVVGMIALGGCSLVPVRRFQIGESVERAQLRWLALAVAVTAAGATIALVLLIVGGPVLVGTLAAILGAGGGMVGIPAAIVFAVVRARLYEIDRLVSRTIAYALVAGVAAAIFAVPVITASAVTGRSNAPVVAASTLASAAIVGPLYRRVRRLVDRSFNRSAFDAQRELARFGEALRVTTDEPALIESVLSVVRRTLQPATSSMWLR